jgi:hypothetical protein
MKSVSLIYQLFQRLADDANALSQHVHRADSYDADAEPEFCEEAVIDILYFIDNMATRLMHANGFGYLD